MTSTASRKQAQRKLAQTRRDSFPAADAGRSAAKNFMNSFPLTKTDIVSVYWPIGSELDTHPLLKMLHEEGIICALPVIEKKDHPLLFRQWYPDMVLQLGPFKVPVPPKSAEVLIPSLVVAPLLAFDAAGYRLGYGGGFYDRTLEKIRKTSGCVAIGIGYVNQEIETVVTDQYDQQLDAMVTEKDVRKFT